MEILSKNIPISELETNDGQVAGLPANPREIQEERFEALKKSIIDAPSMLSMRELLVYPYNGKYVIVGGNMRFRACVEIGYKELPCKIIPASFTPTQLREITIKDNENFGRNDWEKLAAEWNFEELKDWGMEMPEDWENAEAIENGEEGTQVEAEEDDFDEDSDDIPKRCELGDVWQCGEHRLICGDSTDVAVFQKLMDGDKADMVFTDPPYGVSIGDKNKALNSFQPSGRCTENIANDTLKSKDLYPILVAAMANCRENCKSDASYYVTSPQGGELGLMMMMMKDAGLPVRHMLIWEKNSATFSLGRLDYDYQHEPIFYTWTEKHHNYREGEFRTTIWKYDKPRKCDLHPTMKPIPLVANCLKDATKEGDVVLDAFGGSGTTLMACEQLKRKARLIELDPHYCDVILARWESFTNQKAVRL